MKRIQAIEMRLLFVPQAWLQSGLLLLTLMLVTVCGNPMEKNQSLEAQPRTPIEEMQGDTEIGEQQRPNRGDTFNIENSEMDLCNLWLSYNYDFYANYSKLLQKELPSCPCYILTNHLDKVVGLFDHRQNRNFKWQEIKNTEENENAYHPSAGWCMHSLREENSVSMATQLCCYDKGGRLITRGKRAGFPQLISPDISPELHLLVDYVPWNICKGNWSIFHSLLPPNNGLSCPQRPSKGKYEAQLLELSKN